MVTSGRLGNFTASVKCFVSYLSELDVRASVVQESESDEEETKKKKAKIASDSEEEDAEDS